MTKWKWESYKTLLDLKNGLCELKKQGNTFKIRSSDININTISNNVNEIMQIINQHGVFKDGIYQKADPIYIHQINVWLKNKKVICIDVVDNNKNLMEGYKEVGEVNKQIARESIAFYS